MRMYWRRKRGENGELNVELGWGDYSSVCRSRRWGTGHPLSSSHHTSFEVFSDMLRDRILFREAVKFCPSRAAFLEGTTAQGQMPTLWQSVLADRVRVVWRWHGPISFHHPQPLVCPLHLQSLSLVQEKRDNASLGVDDSTFPLWEMTSPLWGRVTRKEAHRELVRFYFILPTVTVGTTKTPLIQQQQSPVFYLEVKKWWISSSL